ncbi:MAG: hypothetical protein Tsb0020_33230 [Haliangiales bacterium]
MSVGPTDIRAQDAATKAVAEQLFREGRALITQGDFEQAAEKLEASLELDSASGTQGSLAWCYEKLGKLASAWFMYTEAAILADRDGNRTRAATARKLANALGPRLPRLQISLVELVPEVRVTLDGTELTTAVLGTAMYVDPGEHVITVDAPGYQPFSTMVTVAEAKLREVKIPTLEPIPEPKPVPPPKPIPAPMPPGSTKEVPPPLRPSPPPADVGRTRRWAGLLTGGAGALVASAGLVVGATAFSAWDDPFVRGDCDRVTLVCSPEGQAATDKARDRTLLANILVGVGAVAIGAGAVLYLTAPDTSPNAAQAARITPTLGPDGVGVAISGRF